MPLKKHIQRNGKTYCWIPEIKKIREFTAWDIDLDKCPIDVLADLMCLLSEDDEQKEEAN